MHFSDVVAAYGRTAVHWVAHLAEITSPRNVRRCVFCDVFVIFSENGSYRTVYKKNDIPIKKSRVRKIDIVYRVGMVTVNRGARL